MLYQINHDLKTKLWCGPAAIAAVTGYPTSIIMQALKEDTGKVAVKGVYNSQLWRVMMRFGYGVAKNISGQNRTLAQFARDHAEDFAKAPMVVNVTGHYLVLFGRRSVDNWTKDPVFISDSPHRLKKVKAAWVFDKRGEAKLPVVAPPAPKRDTMRAVRTKAKALALKHGIDIISDYGTGFRVECPALEHDDPHEGDHFASDWKEVLSQVEDYVDCLTNGYLEAVTMPPSPPPPECPESTAAAVLFRLQYGASDTPMQIACDLALIYRRDITERQVRGAALSLIRQGHARWWRKKLVLSQQHPPA